MENEYYDLDFEEIDTSEFQHGYNDASILADFAPELLQDITPCNNITDNYFTGFFAARMHYLQKEQDNELKELENLRNTLRDKDNELER